MRLSTVSFGIFWLILGVLVGLMARAYGEASRLDVGVSSVLLGSHSEEIRQLKDEVQRLREQNDKLLRELLSGQIGKERIENELENAKLLAGLLPVEGSGIIIRLADAPASAGSVDIDVVETGIIHDYDLLFLLNELKAAGAEAISIGSGNLEERVVANSFIRCTGPTVVINNQKLTAPFIIKAIGDPDVLYSALTMQGGIVEMLRRYGISITVEKNDNIKIVGYSLPLRFSFASIAPSGSKEDEQTSSQEQGTSPSDESQK